MSASTPGHLPKRGSLIKRISYGQGDHSQLVARSLALDSVLRRQNRKNRKSVIELQPATVEH